MKFHITKSKRYLLIRWANLKAVAVLGPARLVGKISKKNPLNKQWEKVHLFRLEETGQLVPGDECFWWFYDEMRRELGDREIKLVKL